MSIISWEIDQNVFYVKFGILRFCTNWRIFSTKSQKEQKKLKIAPKLDKETCRVCWEKKGEIIYNHIRGLSPYPGAWTNMRNGDNQVTLKVFEASFISSKHQYVVGRLFTTDKQLFVAVENGLILLINIQTSMFQKY